MNKKLQIAFGISIALAIFAILNFTTPSGVENWDGSKNNKQILEVLESCEERRISEELYMKYGTISKLTDEKILFSNETHYIDNIECQWALAIPTKETATLPVYEDWEIKFEEDFETDYTEKFD